MTSPYDEEIERLLAQYQQQRDEVASTRARINELTGQATAPRQVVRITVNGQGDVTAVEFPTTAYRRLAGKELADLIVATYRRARDEAQEKLAELMDEQLPGGLTYAGLLGGEDASSLLGDGPSMPDDVRDYIDNGRNGRS